MRRLLLTSLLIALPVSLAAQRTGSVHFSGRPSGRLAAGFARAGYGRTGYYALPLFDPFYADYFSDQYYPPATQPPVILMQLPAAPEPSSPPAQPLLIELQGDRYVQVSGDQTSSSQMMNPVASALPERSGAPTHPPAPPTSTILAFRDGHREEISDYTIADGVLYAAADYYSSAAWNRKVALSSLDLRQTVALNQARGVHFRLPSAPNEVIIGP